MKVTVTEPILKPSPPVRITAEMTQRQAEQIVSAIINSTDQFLHHHPDTLDFAEQILAGLPEDSYMVKVQKDCVRAGKQRAKNWKPAERRYTTNSYDYTF